MSILEVTTEYVIYDPTDETFMGRGDAGWIPLTDIAHAKRFIVPANAQRHCYLDRFLVIPIRVEKTVEVKLVQQ